MNLRKSVNSYVDAFGFELGAYTFQTQHTVDYVAKFLPDLKSEELCSN